MSDNPVYNILVKLVLLGESSVGKSNLFARYTRDTFLKNSKPTIGMDFVSIETKING